MFFKSKFLFFIILVVLIIVGLTALHFWRAFFRPAGGQSTKQYFIVESGQGSQEIANQLKQAGLIDDVFNFEFFVWLKRADHKFKAGEYLLTPTMSIRAIVNLMTVQGGTNELTIKIPEGWTNQEIGSYLESQGIVSAQKFFQAAGFPMTGAGASQNSNQDFAKDYDFLSDKPPAAGLEGYLFPDTYRIYRQATADIIVSKMLDNFDKKLTPATRQAIKNNKMTIFETLTMASILEAEVLTYEDRRMAASVFYKRLNAGMPLQADSTVNYATGKNVFQSSLADLKIDSPYNTYKYRGLPPGPINNPGLVSIQAAIYPLKNNYWFFLTDKEGKAHFAETMAEHQENRKKYLE